MSTSRSGPDARDLSFEVFVARAQASLFRTALLLCGDRASAEDLVQIALVRVYGRWDRLADQEPAAYARRVLVNAHHDDWRRGRGREQLVAEPPASASTPDGTDRVDERDALVASLRTLTARERRVVVLRFLYDLSEADTARELGMRVGTVKSTANRAIGKLRASELLAGPVPREPR